MVSSSGPICGRADSVHPGEPPQKLSRFLGDEADFTAAVRRGQCYLECFSVRCNSRDQKRNHPDDLPGWSLAETSHQRRSFAQIPATSDAEPRSSLGVYSVLTCNPLNECDRRTRCKSTSHRRSSSGCIVSRGCERFKYHRQSPAKVNRRAARDEFPLF